MSTLQGYSFREGQLVVANIALDSSGRATTRYAEVRYASQHGDALCLVDVTGKTLDGEIVSMMSMSPTEEREWHAFNEPDAADGFADERSVA